NFGALAAVGRQMDHRLNARAQRSGIRHLHLAVGVVPLCDASEGPFSGDLLSSTFTCWLKYWGFRWAYLCVILMFRCPSSFCTTSKSTPFMTSQLAKQWRRSCHRKLVIPARFTAVFHPFLISRIASPAN